MNLQFHHKIVVIVYLTILVSTLAPLGYNNIITFAQEEIEGVNASIGGGCDDDEEEPSIKDPNLGAELVSDGLEFPTSMAF